MSTEAVFTDVERQKAERRDQMRAEARHSRFQYLRLDLCSPAEMIDLLDTIDRLTREREEVRREALEEAAKVAETRHVHWHMPHPDDAFPGEVKCDVTACADIAKAIRSLSPQGG